MSKLSWVAMAVATVALWGCQPPAYSDTETASGTDREMVVFTDPKTGCDYISPTGYVSHTMPRISSDGYTVFCADQKRALSESGQ